MKTISGIFPDIDSAQRAREACAAYIRKSEILYAEAGTGLPGHMEPDWYGSPIFPGALSGAGGLSVLSQTHFAPPRMETRGAELRVESNNADRETVCSLLYGCGALEVDFLL